jgi:hypothetical protein
MSERLAKSKHTLITDAIFDALTRIQITAGFGQNLKAERLNEHNHEYNQPEHLKAVLDPGDPQKQENASAGLDEYIRTYLIHVDIIPSQTSGLPLDETWDAIASDVVQGLCEDDGTVNPLKWNLNGLAQDVWADSAITEAPPAGSLAWRLHVPINVRYTTRERNAYLND